MIEINWFLTDRNKLVLFLEDGSENTYLAIFTMLIIGRDIYGEGRTCKFSAGGVFKVSSSQLLCHERATIKGVHLQNKNQECKPNYSTSI
jgi:hypothetical protein